MFLKSIRSSIPAFLSALFFLSQALAQDFALLDDTRNRVLPLLPKVVGTMQQAIKDSGVDGALPVCKEKAPAMLQEVREQTGWDIRRVSLKTRNTKTGTPDTWEARQLAEFNIRAAAGMRPDQLEVYEIVTDADNKRFFRYMKALPVGEVCVVCHGTQENLSVDLKQALDKMYPGDRAIGYQPGQVRGALTVKRPL